MECTDDPSNITGAKTQKIRNGEPDNLTWKAPMSNLRWCRVGLYLAPKDVYAFQYREAIEHAGLRFDVLDTIDESALRGYDVVLLCGYGELNTLQAAALLNWVALGGRLVASGSAWGISSLIGLGATAHHVSIGHVTSQKPDRVWPEGSSAIKTFGGRGHTPGESEVIAAWNQKFVAASRRSIKAGSVHFVAPHVGQTISMMVFGRSVETDGIGPADTSAVLDDGILRAEDGTMLDFAKDRPTEGQSMPYFAHAHADAVRELWLRSVFEACECTNKALMVTWHLPGSATSAAMLTIDCAEPNVDQFQDSHRFLANLGARPSWLVGHIGFPNDIYRVMNNSLHEVGVLYDRAHEDSWESEKLRLQHLSLTRAAATRHSDAIRASNGRWEGYLQPYNAIARSSARISVAKGGRQPGTSGFLFGGSRPVQAIHRDGTATGVFEVPYVAFVPKFPDPAAENVITEVAQRHGIFHIAAELGDLKTIEAQASLRRLIMLAKQAHMKFILPSELAHLETQRRQLRVQVQSATESNVIAITPIEDIEDLTLLFSGIMEMEATCMGNPMRVERVHRYGMGWWRVTLDLEGKRTTPIIIEGEPMLAAA